MFVFILLFLHLLLTSRYAQLSKYDNCSRSKRSKRINRHRSKEI